jgi:hypothetical protein
MNVPSLSHGLIIFSIDRMREPTYRHLQGNANARCETMKIQIAGNPGNQSIGCVNSLTIETGSSLGQPLSARSAGSGRLSLSPDDITGASFSCYRFTNILQDKLATSREYDPFCSHSP